MIQILMDNGSNPEVITKVLTCLSFHFISISLPTSTFSFIKSGQILTHICSQLGHIHQHYMIDLLLDLHPLSWYLPVRMPAILYKEWTWRIPDAKNLFYDRRESTPFLILYFLANEKIMDQSSYYLFSFHLYDYIYSALSSSFGGWRSSIFLCRLGTCHHLPPSWLYLRSWWIPMVLFRSSGPWLARRLGHDRSTLLQAI